MQKKQKAPCSMTAKPPTLTECVPVFICPHCRHEHGSIRPTSPGVGICDHCHKPSFTGPRMRWLDGKSQPIDFDNNHWLKTRRAWRNAKRAFGGWHHLETLMMVLELESPQPSLALAAAVLHFLSAPPDERLAIHREYSDFSTRCGFSRLEPRPAT